MTSRQPIRQFKVYGMDCAEEVAVLKQELGPLLGSEDRLAFDLLSAKMTVTAERQDLSDQAIVDAVSRTGMQAAPWEEGGPSGGQETRGRWTNSILTASSGAFTLLGFVWHAWSAGGVQAALGSEGMGFAHAIPWPVRVMYSLGILSGLWMVLPKAWLAARRLRPDMNLLMTVAVVGAIVIGEWLEASTVAFLFALSLALESWSVGRARRAIEALLDLTPTTVRVLNEDGKESESLPDDVQIGSMFLVKPGERIPLDGLVRRGSSHVNQAPITGESAPVPKELDDEVFAGTINGDGALEVRSTKAAGETTLAHIIRMVGEAQSRRAPSEKWVEKFAAAYTPVVFALAIAVCLVPPLVFQQSWQEWIYRSLVLLVIACPCALVISTPVSIVAGLAAAARHGILIKGGVYLETPARLKAIAFDKTGTLTEGKPKVVEVVPLHDHSRDELLERAGSLELRSEHPIAEAIVAYAREEGVNLRPADEFQIIQGKGAIARIDGRSFWLGSHKFLEERGQETPDIHARLQEMSQTGRTVVVVGNDEHVCGLFAIGDSVRGTASSSLHDLRSVGIEHLVMLTGDNEPTARAIADKVGLDEVHAELLPDAKVAAVDALVDRFQQVAMVGDGVNDAPALGRATLGIAMGAAGSDAAIETADVALMSDDLSKLAWLVRHSRRTLMIIKQNIFLSLAVKLVFASLTFVGFAYLWMAIAADMGASFLVIANGLRLLREGE